MDATVATRILEAGGIIKGKEFCENISMSAASFTAATGSVDNPNAKCYSAGGSSSGTPNPAAKGEVSLGIVADQGGSIRITASLCGLFGFKATSGLVPYTGCVWWIFLEHVSLLKLLLFDTDLVLISCIVTKLLSITLVHLLELALTTLFSWKQLQGWMALTTDSRQGHRSETRYQNILRYCSTQRTSV
jgi:hypothetical protein